MFKLVSRLLFVLVLSCTINKKPPFPVTELNYPADLNIVKRADWGWKALPDTLPQQRIKRITIHHGGTTVPDTMNAVAYVRHMQDWSRSEKHWIDIPYHFMIDLQGKIYETRPINYPGDTNTDYDVRGHALINVIGNYENRALSPVQLDALVRLCAFLSQKYNVDTTNIRGHKDYTETLCPGKNLYRYLQDGSIRKQVSELLKK